MHDITDGSLPHPWSYGEVRLSPLKRALLISASPLLLALFVLRLCLFLVCAFASWFSALITHNIRFLTFAHKVIGRLALMAYGVWPGMLEVHGDLDDRASVLICAPHYGLYDAFVLMCAARFPRPIAIAAWAKNPLASRQFKAVGGIAVNVRSANAKPQVSQSTSGAKTRETTPGVAKASAPTARQAIVEHKRTFKRGDKPVCIFPEGTTSNGHAVLGFFSGAFEGGGPVQPLVFRYRYQHFNAAAFLTSLPAHMVRALLTPWQHVRVDFLPLYEPSEEEAADPSLCAENLRQAMAKAANLPLSPHDAKSLRQELASGCAKPEGCKA